MGVKRRKAPQVFPCIDCGGTGRVTDDSEPVVDGDVMEAYICERCDGSGVEATR